MRTAFPQRPLFISFLPFRIPRTDPGRTPRVFYGRVLLRMSAGRQPPLQSQPSAAPRPRSAALAPAALLVPSAAPRRRRERQPPEGRQPCPASGADDRGNASLSGLPSKETVCASTLRAAAPAGEGCIVLTAFRVTRLGWSDICRGDRRNSPPEPRPPCCYVT